MPRYIHWFRRDLRLHDNPALLAALRASGGQVIPLFILDDSILQAPDTAAARVAFLLDSLHALDQALQQHGSRLLLRRGRPLDTLRELIDSSGATGVYWNRDYTPAALERDTTVETALRSRSLDVRTFKEAVIWEPDEIRTAAGGIYSVYTPYARTWRARLEAELHTILATETPLPGFAPLPAEINSLPIPQPDDLGFSTDQHIPAGGEAAGLARLAEFIDSAAIQKYAGGRDIPAIAGTSRLSAYLRFGCIAIRTCLRHALIAAESAPARPHGPATWIGELAWRDFYYQIMANYPYVLERAFKPAFDTIVWDNDPHHFDAWRTGKTGYPIVDAAMRQLAAEAWMHNRARMIVASFLTKDLLIDWRLGERHFMLQLVDGDPASNNGGWQWAAGTGSDAQPFFRIFNPTSQGQKFDPDGEYVRRYLPELARVPDRYIHTPWRMPPEEQHRAGVRIGHDYPAPIVDHAEQRARALERYRAARTEQ